MAIAPVKPATNDVQPVKRRGRTEGAAQIHVLSASARCQGRELGVGQRPRESERASGEPDQQEERCAWNRGGHLRRREENAATDDVGDDDGRRVERTETPRERG